MASATIPARQSRTHHEPTLLFGTGFALTVLGLALAAAPQISWQLSKVARAFAEMGLDSGAFVASGLALAGLGLVARIALQSHAGGSDAESRAAIEALRAEIHELRLAQARSEQLLQRAAAAAAPAPPASPASNGAPQVSSEQLSALFRMAASLDQLGAKLQQGLKSEIAGLEQRLARPASGPAAPLAAAHAASHAVAAPRPRAETAASIAKPAPADRANPSHATPSLGVLDELDDLTVIDERGHAVPGADSGMLVDLDATAAPMPASMPASAARDARPAAVEQAGPKLDLDALLPESQVEKAKRDSRA